MSSTTDGRAIALNRREFSDDEIEERLVRALQQSRGEVTLAELVQRTGLPALILEPVLRRAMLRWDLTIVVRPDGQLAWDVGPSGLTERVDSEALRRLQLKRRIAAFFKALFKIGIVIALVGFFILLVALTIAAFVALAAGKGESSDDNRRRSDHRSSGGPDIILLPRLFGRGVSTSRRTRRASDRYTGAPAEDTRGFVDKVFAFVFGDEADDIDELYTESQILARISAERGVMAPMELSAYTGWSPRAAEKESSRLLGQYDGNVEILPDGSTLFVFDDFSERVERGAEPLPYFWRRYERKLATTGNTSNFNALMVGMNGFILLGSLWLMPSFISPVLGLEQVLSPGTFWGGFVALPAIYALLFFAIPIARHLGPVARENNERQDRNLRRVLLQEIYRRAESGHGIIDREELLQAADRARPSDAHFPFPPLPQLERVLDDLVHEWSAPSDFVNGRKLHDFRAIQRQRESAAQARARTGSRAQHRLVDQLAAFDEALQNHASLVDYDPLATGTRAATAPRNDANRAFDRGNTHPEQKNEEAWVDAKVPKA